MLFSTFDFLLCFSLPLIFLDCVFFLPLTTHHKQFPALFLSLAAWWQIFRHHFRNCKETMIIYPSDIFSSILKSQWDLLCLKCYLLSSLPTLRTSKRPAPLVLIVKLASLLSYLWSGNNSASKSHSSYVCEVRPFLRFILHFSVSDSHICKISKSSWWLLPAEEEVNAIVAKVFVVWTSVWEFLNPFRNLENIEDIIVVVWASVFEENHFIMIIEDKNHISNLPVSTSSTILAQGVVAAINIC